MILVIPVSEITKDSPWYKGETSVQPPSQKDLIYECYDRLYEVAKMVRDKCREQPDRYSVRFDVEISRVLSENSSAMLTSMLRRPSEKIKDNCTRDIP